MLTTKFHTIETTIKGEGATASTAHIIDLGKFGLAEIEDFADRRVIRGGRFRATLPARVVTRDQPDLFDASLTDAILSRIGRPAKATRNSVTEAQCRAARKVKENAKDQAEAYMNWYVTSRPAALIKTDPDGYCAGWRSEWCEAAGEMRTRYIAGVEIPNWDYVPTVTEFQTLDDGAEPAITWLTADYLGKLIREREALVAAERAEEARRRAFWSARGRQAYETFTAALGAYSWHVDESPMAQIARAESDADVSRLVALYHHRQTCPPLYWLHIDTTPAGRRATGKLYRLRDAAQMPDITIPTIHRTGLVREITITGNNAAARCAASLTQSAHDDTNGAHVIIRDGDHLRDVLVTYIDLPQPAPTPDQDAPDAIYAPDSDLPVGPLPSPNATPSPIRRIPGKPVAAIPDSVPGHAAIAAPCADATPGGATCQPHRDDRHPRRAHHHHGARHQIAACGRLMGPAGRPWPMPTLSLGGGDHRPTWRDEIAARRIRPAVTSGRMAGRTPVRPGNGLGAGLCLGARPLKAATDAETSAAAPRWRNEYRLAGRIPTWRNEHSLTAAILHPTRLNGAVSTGQAPCRIDDFPFGARRALPPQGWRLQWRRDAYLVQKGAEQGPPLQDLKHGGNAFVEILESLMPSSQFGTTYHPSQGTELNLNFRLNAGHGAQAPCIPVPQRHLRRLLAIGDLARIIPVTVPLPALGHHDFTFCLAIRFRQPLDLHRLQVDGAAPVPITPLDGPHMPTPLPFLRLEDRLFIAPKGAGRHADPRGIPNHITLPGWQHAHRRVHRDGIDMPRTAHVTRTVQGEQHIRPAPDAPGLRAQDLGSIGPAQQRPHAAPRAVRVFRPPALALSGGDGQRQVKPRPHPFAIVGGVGGAPPLLAG